jgi:1-acyl-sn-glycerol-3-phosphate acyltransferase
MQDEQPTPDGEIVAALLQAIRELVAEARPAGAAPPVRLDSRLDTDLGLDSLAVAELLVRVGEVFDVALPDGSLVSVETPRDLLEELTTAASGADRVSRPAHPTARLDVPAGSGAVPVDASSLVEVLEWHASAQPDRTHLRLLGEAGAVEELSYGALLLEASAVAANLRGRQLPARTAVALMLPTGRDYFVTFFGVLLAGCVPVPVYPPGRPSGLEDHLRRHVRLLDNAQAAALVTVPAARSLARLIAPQIPTLRHVVTVDDLRTTDVDPRRAAPGSAETALLQYTSGSTGDPKGVVLSHANLLANIRAMGRAGDIQPTDVFVSWLPLYHDMGLIGSWLLSLYFGIPFVVMSPLAFLTRPARWLWAIHEHGGTVSGGPNFGYELCLRRIDDRELEGLDLGSWRLAFNGAEPVSPSTVTRFTERFAGVGLRPGAMTPVYGLAESSVALTVPPLGRGVLIDRIAREPLARSGRAVPATDDDETAARLVACGGPLPGHEVRIADRAGMTLGEREEGRVEFRGPSTTAGYHRNRAATRRLLDGDWLDSGDLGYLAGGELYLTGRVKDVIIRAGRNLHPAELEEAVGAVPGVRKGCVAVFPTTDPAVGTERLVVVAEVRSTDAAEPTCLRRAVNGAVTDLIGAPPDEVVLAPPGVVPKTSSGKIRRAEARERYERGRLGERGRAVWWQLLRLAVTSLPSQVSRAGPKAVEAIYGVYANALFTLFAVGVWLLVALVPGTRRRWRVVRGAGGALFRFVGIRLDVEGIEHLPAGRPYVVAANHASNLDPLVLAVALPEPAVFAAVGGLAANPFARLFLRRLEAHLVTPGDRARGVEDSRALTETVRSGRIVAFFPEGRRSPVVGLEPFHMGAFVVAADAGVPVVPVALRGTRRILPVGRRLPRRGPLTVTITPPVSSAEAGWPGAVELHTATRPAILRHCGEPDLG